MKAFVLIDGLGSELGGYATMVIEEGEHKGHIARVSIIEGQTTVSCSCGEDIEHTTIDLEGSKLTRLVVWEKEVK